MAGLSSLAAIRRSRRWSIVCASPRASQANQLPCFSTAVSSPSAPPEVADSRVFDVTWVGDEDVTEEAFADQLEEMRKQMVEQVFAAVFIGGRTVGSLGQEPGIVQEYRLCCGEAGSPSPRNSVPAYLVGLLDGQVQQMIRQHETSHQHEPNGLSREELELLHYSDDTDLVAGIILADLLRSARHS